MKKTKIEFNIRDFPEELHPYLAGAEIYDSSSCSSAKVYYISTGYFLKVDVMGALERESAMVIWFYRAGLGVRMVKYFQSRARDYMLTKAAEGEDCLACLKHPKQLCEILAKAMRRLHSVPIPELQATDSVGSDLPVSGAIKNFKESMNKELPVRIPSEKPLPDKTLLAEDAGNFCADILMPRFMVYSRDEAWEIMQKNKHRLKCDTLIHGDFCLPNMIVKDGEFSCFIDLALAGVGDRHIDLYWVLWSLHHNLGTEEYTDYFLDQYGRENFDYDMLKVVAAFEAFG